MHKFLNFNKALITGASSGIGEALCIRLAEEGIALIITGRDRARLEALADLLKSKVSVEIIEADLANQEQRNKLLEKIHKDCPDLIVNNAGFGLYGETLTYETQEQANIIEVNAKALLELTLEGARTMVSRNKKGVVLNISSAADRIVIPGMAVYAASKAFATQLSLALHYEMKPYGVSVLVACPGMVDTNFRHRASKGQAPTKDRFSMNATWVANRLWQQIVRREIRVVFDWKTRLGHLFATLIPNSWVAAILYSQIKSYQALRTLLKVNNDNK